MSNFRQFDRATGFRLRLHDGSSCKLERATYDSVRFIAANGHPILAVEIPNEILADKAVALVARDVLKYRDVWDVWYLVNRLDAHVDRNLVQHKFADYGTVDVETRARSRREELAKEST